MTSTETTATGTGRIGIGDFARLSGLTPKALRLYHELELLLPAEVDPVTGYRGYEPGQLDRARLVARLRLVGMPLARIRVVADAAAGSDPRAAAAELTSYWRQVEADTGSARALVSLLLTQLDQHDQEETAMTTTLDTDEAPLAAARSGQGHRPTQLDAAHAAEGVHVVADGFGDAPDLPATIVAALAGEMMALPPGSDAVAALDAAFARAVGLVARGWTEHPGAGTTATALVLRGGRAVLGHLGDSRAYRVRGGRVERLTRDHTLVQTLVDEGRLTPEEARSDDRRAQLNRAVSADVPCTPDLAAYAVEPGDRYVLTTDGVHARLDPADLAALLRGTGTVEDVAEAVTAAVEAAGPEDNHTVVVVDVPS